MKIPATARVRAAAGETFSPVDAATACDELAAADLPLIANNGERVHLAVIHLSRGDLAAFRRHLAHAQRDWRDVLAATGF